jgi:hypothetical protein
MADFAMGSSGTGRVECWLNWDSSTQASFHYKLSAEIRNGANNTVGDASWNGTLNGGYDTNGWRTLREFDVTINKDANGYLTVGVYGYINGANAPFVSSGSASFNVGTTRQGIAPTISAITSDTIKPTTARLGAELSSVGLGTSATWTMYYRLTGAGSWTSAGAQADAGGYNYWSLTGLKPGKNYQYYATCANNNGDTATSSTGTFKTKGLAGATVVMTKLAGL